MYRVLPLCSFKFIFCRHVYACLFICFFINVLFFYVCKFIIWFCFVLFQLSLILFLTFNASFAILQRYYEENPTIQLIERPNDRKYRIVDRTIPYEAFPKRPKTHARSDYVWCIFLYCFLQHWSYCSFTFVLLVERRKIMFAPSFKAIHTRAPDSTSIWCTISWTSLRVDPSSRSSPHTCVKVWVRCSAV